MKKLGFFIYFSTLSASIFGQQALWSTIQDADMKYVPLNNVTKEVMNFYDMYDYYYDYTGFDKDSFIETYNDAEDSDWNWFYDVESMTVIAMRMNIEEGVSGVYVFCVDRDGVDMILFSNKVSLDGIVGTSTGAYRKDRFEKWFKTLLN